MTALPVSAARFSDTTGHWAETDIEKSAELGYFVGGSDGLFYPNGSMTRGMFVTTLGRMAETAGVLNAPSELSVFPDVNVNAYYAIYVAWASENKIVNGYNDGRFAPDDTVTREQLCTMLVRFLTNCTKLDLSVYSTDSSVFADSDAISSYAKDAVGQCYSAGIVNGKDNNQFDPAGTATRAEVAKILVYTANVFGVKLAPAEAGPIDGGIIIPVPGPTPDNIDTGDEHTDEEIAAEAQFADDLQSILTDAGTASLAYQIKHADSEVNEFINTLLTCVRDALDKRDHGAFLSEEYIRTTYKDTISTLRTSYKDMSSSQQSELKDIAIGFARIQSVLDYFGYGDKL